MKIRPTLFHSEILADLVQGTPTLYPLDLLFVVGVQQVEGLGVAVGVVEADLQGLAGYEFIETLDARLGLSVRCFR